jgi:hypothetical protein
MRKGRHSVPAILNPACMWLSDDNTNPTVSAKFQRKSDREVAFFFSAAVQTSRATVRPAGGIRRRAPARAWAVCRMFAELWQTVQSLRELSQGALATAGRLHRGHTLENFDTQQRVFVHEWLLVDVAEGHACDVDAPWARYGHCRHQQIRPSGPKFPMNCRNAKHKPQDRTACQLELFKRGSVLQMSAMNI